MAAGKSIEYKLSLDTRDYESKSKKAAATTDALAQSQKSADGQEMKKGLDGTSGALDGYSGKAKNAGDATGRFSDNLRKGGETAGRVGKKLMGMTAALGGIAVAAATAANGYDREFSKIEGLVGIAGDKVEAMKVSTLELAGATAQAPAALAKSMFTLQSAGLRGATAMEALETSAKLAAGGMGEAGDIAQAMTSILDQYASSGVDAAEAGDFLAATARAGNFESSQLAGALGKVLPVASTLGIKLSDVGGTVALLTRGNGNASESVTQLAATLRFMLSPSRMAIKGLSEVGMTVDDLKETAAGPGGLVAALEQMYEAFDGNDQAFAKALGSAEAVNAAFQILGASNEALEGTFGAVANSAGVAAEVFDAAAATDSFKFEQAMSEIKTTFIEIGQDVAPMLASAVGKISDVFASISGWWSTLGDGPKDLIKTIGVVVAAVGPLLLVFSKVTAGVLAAKTAFLTFGLAGGPVMAGLAAVTVAVGLVANSWMSAKREAKEAAERVETLTEAMRKNGDPTLALTDKYTALAEAIRQTKAVASGDTFSDFTITTTFDQMEIDGVVDKFRDVGLSVADVHEITRDLSGDDALANWMNRLGDATETNATAPAYLRRELQALSPEARKVADSLLAQWESNRGARDSTEDLADSMLTLMETQKQARTEIDEGAEAAFRRAAAEAGLGSAFVNSARTISGAGRAGAGGGLKDWNTVMEENIHLFQAYSRGALGTTAATQLHAAEAKFLGGERAVADHTAAMEDNVEVLKRFSPEWKAAVEELPEFEQALAHTTEEMQLQYNAQAMLSEAVQHHKQILDGTITAERNHREALRNRTKATSDLEEAQKKFNESEQTPADLLELTVAMEAYASQGRDLGFAILTAEGAHGEFNSTVEETEATIRRVGEASNLTADEIDTLIRLYADIGNLTDKELRISVSMAGAIAELEAFWDIYADSNGNAIIQEFVLSPSLDSSALASIRSQLNAATSIDPTYGAADFGSIGNGGMGQQYLNINTTGADQTMMSFFSYWQSQQLTIQASASGVPAGATPNGYGGYSGQGFVEIPTYGVNQSLIDQLNAANPSNPGSTIYYHNGGVVPQPSGGYPGLRSDEVPAVLQAGERVVSRAEIAAQNQGYGVAAEGGGSGTINVSVNMGGVHGAPGQSTQQLADQVAEKVAARFSSSISTFR